MTALQLAAMINRRGYLRVPAGIAVIVRVTDARVAYGTTQYQVEPIAGQGRAWVNASSVVFSQGASHA